MKVHPVIGSSPGLYLKKRLFKTLPCLRTYVLLYALNLLLAIFDKILYFWYSCNLFSNYNNSSTFSNWTHDKRTYLSKNLVIKACTNF
jgi:hypothetical protein